MNIFSKSLLSSKCTLTVVTTPVDATCTLTSDGVQYVTKSLTVKKGSTIFYSIYHPTYGTTSGAVNMSSGKTLTCIGISSPGFVDVSFSQPALSANGTLGGSSFAVYASKEQSTGYALWKAFDKNTSTCWSAGAGANTTNFNGTYFTIYNPAALKVSSLSITNRSGVNGYTPKNGTVYGSDNNSSWTSIATYSNSDSTAGSVWTLSVGSSNYYKYYKIVVSEILPYNNIYYSIQLAEIGVNGVYQSSTTTYSWNTTIT